MSPSTVTVADLRTRLEDSTCFRLWTAKSSSDSAT